MLDAFLIGVGATAFMDLTSLIRASLGVPFPDYGLVGRWLASAARGRFAPGPISTVPPVKGEATIGWSAHYGIGIAYAALLLAAFPTWAERPTLTPALLVGVGTILAPFLIMQPGMGAGFFASRTPDPAMARLHSLITHALFGLGLYAAGVARVLAFQ